MLCCIVIAGPMPCKLCDVHEGLRAIYHQNGLSRLEHLVPPGIQDAWEYYQHLLKERKEQEDAMLEPVVEREKALQRFKDKLCNMSSQLRAQQSLEAARAKLDEWVAKQQEPIRQGFEESDMECQRQLQLLLQLVASNVKSAEPDPAPASPDSHALEVDECLDSMLATFIEEKVVSELVEDMQGLSVEAAKVTCHAIYAVMSCSVSRFNVYMLL